MLQRHNGVYIVCSVRNLLPTFTSDLSLISAGENGTYFQL